MVSNFLKTNVVPIALNVGLFGIYVFASLFVFLYKAYVGEAFLLLFAVTLAAINILKRYRLLYMMNLVVVAGFLAFYARDINAFGFLCAVAFLAAATGMSFLIARTASRSAANSPN